MSDPATPKPPSAWWSLAVTTAIQAMVSMALLTLPAMAPVAAQGLGVPPALVGAYVALCYLAAMLSSLIGGTLVRRLGAIRVSQLGLALCAIGLLLCAVPWLPAVALGALCIGAGYGPITPASSHLLALTTPAHRMALVFSIKQTGVPAGGMLAGALVPGLSLWLGWQGTLAVVAGVCAACAVLSQPLRAALDADRQPSQALALGALFRPVGMVLGHRSLAVLMIVGSVLTALLQPGWPTALIWAIVALLGASAIGWNGVYLATVARQAPPGQAATATGGTLMFTFMGVVLGSPAFGALAGFSGSYRLAFAALALPAALALGLLLWRARQVRREAALQAPEAAQ